MLKKILSTGTLLLLAGRILGQGTGSTIDNRQPPFRADGIITGAAPTTTRAPTEFLIDTSITYAPAPASQDSVSIAFDGTNYLVVWQDQRNGNYDIYATRVTQSGSILNPTGIPISTAAGDQMAPSVVFDGTNYLVVWQDRRNYSFDWDIYGARVSPAGTVLDPDGFAIETHVNVQSSPVVAFDGSNYLVAWQDRRNDAGDIYGALVKPTGTIITTIGIATQTGEQNSPAVAFDGTNYLVVWQDRRSGTFDIYGSRVSVTGTVLNPTGIPISTATGTQGAPAVAFDSTNYLVVWADYRTGDSARIYGSRVSPAGTVLDPTGIVVADTGRAPSIGFDGKNYLVVGQHNGIKGARVSRAGTVVDSAAIAVSAAGAAPAVAFGDTSYLVAWQNIHIDGARLNRDGQVLDSKSFTVSTAAHSQLSPAVAFDGENYFTVWSDGRGQYAGIFGARVKPTGMVMDPTGFRLLAAAGDQTSPTIALGDTNYLVAWEGFNKSLPAICGVRISPAGAVLDSQALIISPASQFLVAHPSIAFDGTNYFVVWSSFKSGHVSIYGSRITPSGTMLDPDGILISQRKAWSFNGSVAFDGRDYLVAWDDGKIYGERVSVAGTVLDPNPFVVSKTANGPANPAVASDGTNCLVAWEDYSAIYGELVTQSGTVVGSTDIALSPATGIHSSPALAFDGSKYVVAWEDSTGTGHDLSGALVNPAGMVIGSFPVSTDAGDQSSPALARGSSDQVLITYQGWTGIFDGKSYNAQRIWGELFPQAGIEERPTPDEERFALHLYPRPAKSFLVIHSPLPVSAVEIFDVVGNLVGTERYAPDVDTQMLTINLKNMASGIYFLRVETSTRAFTEKVIIIK